MPKYRVSLADGREVHAYAPDESGALRQALHHESTRVVIASKRGWNVDGDKVPYASAPMQAVKVKD